MSTKENIFRNLVEYNNIEEEDFKPYMKLFPNKHFSELYVEALYLSEATYGNFDDELEGTMFSYMDCLLEDDTQWEFRDLQHLLHTLCEIYA